MNTFEFMERNPWLTFWLALMAAWAIGAFAEGIGGLIRRK